MRTSSIRMFLGMCAVAAAVAGWAQASRKPGLWEMTSTMTWQQSPFAAGVSKPPGGNSPFSGGARTTQVCHSQAMFDKYGAPVPESSGGCQLSHVQKRATSMTGDWVCNGLLAGKGTVESSWNDSNHATSKIHFMGWMKMGSSQTPVEYTIVSSSTYKGADCGSVKPVAIPEK